MTAVATPPVFHPPRRFDNGAEWLHALGDVPMARIIFDPWPGTATEADLLRFVERDKRLCELIDGTLVEKTVGYWESLIAMNLSTELAIYAKKTKAGVVSGADSTLRMKSTNRIRLPDVSFISFARLPKTREPVPTLAPDLAVEVLSEGNTSAEMQLKLADYFQSGSRLAWIIDPVTRSAAVYHAAGEPTHVVDISGSLDGEEVLPGFKLALAKLFENVPEASA